MKSITHSYFGFLDGDELKEINTIWEKSFALNGETFEVALWAGSSANAEQQTIMLDAFEAFLQQLPAMDLLARQQLKHYLTENSDFIDFHIEEIPEDSDGLSRLQHFLKHQVVRCQLLLRPCHHLKHRSLK